MTFVNQDPRGPADVSIDLLGGDIEEATARSLSGPSVRAENTVENPQAVVPEKAEVRFEGGQLRLHLLPGSVQAVKVRLKGA